MMEVKFPGGMNNGDGAGNPITAWFFICSADVGNSWEVCSG
jgi:hypothetical protein